MASDELDALLTAGVNPDGSTAALSAKELNRILKDVRSGFGKKKSRASSPGLSKSDEAPPTPRVQRGSSDELGAAFDALEAGEKAEAPAPRRFAPLPSLGEKDSVPTRVVDPASLEAEEPEGYWDEVDVEELPTAAMSPKRPAPPPYPAVPRPPPLPGSVQPVTTSNSPTLPPAGPASGTAGSGSFPAPTTSPPQSGSVQIRPSAMPPAVVAESPPVQSRPRTGLIAAVVMSIITILALTLFLLLRSSSGEPAQQRTGDATAPGAGAQAGGAVSASPAEAAARAALWRMAEGVRACARNVLGDLPGSAPAIPASFNQLKGGVYASAPNDYRSPVYSCTNFRQTDPQAFQIQWQIFKDKSEGMAIAWLDTNSDGKPDRALGLRAKLVKAGEVSIGEIEVIEPLPAVSNVR